MKISPINSVQPSCKARFSHADVQKLIDSTKNLPAAKEKIPQLYTMLEYLFLIPNTKKAKLGQNMTHKFIEVDGEVYGKAKVSQSLFNALKNACIACAKLNNSEEVLQPHNHNYMSVKDFEKSCEKYKDVTKDEVHAWGWN